MSLARSKITAQGQISVPSKVRQKLGVGPGSVLVWEEEKGSVVVRRGGAYSFDDLHSALFPDGPPKRRSFEELRAGIGEHVRRKHERG